MNEPLFRRKQPEPEDEAWLITFADMCVLLMSFFILMFALSKSDPQEMSYVAKSLRDTGFYVGDNVHVDPLGGVKQNLSTELEKLGYGLFVATSETPRGVEIELAASTLFDPGSAKFTPSALPAMQAISRALVPLANKDFTVEVEGHTDDNAVTGEQFPSNWELSSARSSNMVRYLIAQDFPANKLRATGLADTHPKAPNRDEAGNPIPANQDLNRRVTIRLIRGADN